MKTNSTDTTIITATTPGDYEAFGRLCRDYVEWCRLRYHEVPWLVDEVFGYQSLEEELKTLSTAYGPPEGKTLLAVREGAVVGSGAYRRLSNAGAEMKRLYVSDRAKGHGVGRLLCSSLLAAAKTDGFGKMLLDTGKLQTEAIAMYQSMGFAPCPPYHSYPAKFMPYLVFMEKKLE
jgi:GNAT superfamily N-acetyltransferase